MSYQVLARKWRPHAFSEMVGQEHVLRALINALDNDRLHHAFLFTGTRGVGKTTIARILAKSLNCEQGVSSRPCGECASCVEIDEGRFVDLIEVDAASRTKVEDTRDLLDNVQYAPTRGRYKVYLIDEVHMLSGHSFNALLKTLEEPPPHVKFLLATTDPQKLPITILSRCLQFNLKRLPAEPIRDYLAAILEREGIDGEPAALTELARGADGSMRDALSLLDQAIAYGNGRVDHREVCDMLGTVDRGSVVGLVNALAARDGAALLERVRDLAAYGPDFSGLLAELVALLHRIALVQTVPDLDDDLEWGEDWRELANALSPEEVQLFYQIGIVGGRDLPLAPDPRSGFEMVLLRMLAFRPFGQPAESAESARPEQSRKKAPGRPEGKPAQAMSTPSAQGGKREWPEVARALDLSGLNRQLVMQASLAAWEDDRIDLVIEPAHGHLLNKQREGAIRQALEAYLKSPVRLRIRAASQVSATPAQLEQKALEERQRAAEAAIRDDPNVKSLLERFDGHIQPDSIESND